MSIHLELTERCNNNCIHCCINLPEKSHSAQKKELSTEEWKSILQQAADLGVLTVRFTGGEPLLRNDFSELYLFARRLGLRVLLSTNGRLITEDIIKLFTEIPPLEEIEVTVYGMSRLSYEAVSRVPGSHKECKRGIDLLLSHNIPFLVKGTVFPETISEFDEFIQWSSTIPAMKDYPAFPLFLDLRHRRDSNRKNKKIASLRIDPKKALDIVAMNPEKYRQVMAKFCEWHLEKPSTRLFNCNHGNMVVVDAYGKYQFCAGMRAPSTTVDFRKHSLEYMIGEFIPKLRMMKALDMNYLERCACCFLRGLCEQCPAKSWSECGELDKPVEYLCEVAHEQARFLGLLTEGEKAWKIKDWKDRLAQIIEKEDNTKGYNRK